jgi:hypothetical protein
MMILLLGNIRQQCLRGLDLLCWWNQMEQKEIKLFREYSSRHQKYSRATEWKNTNGFRASGSGQLGMFEILLYRKYSIFRFHFSVQYNS